MKNTQRSMRYRSLDCHPRHKKNRVVKNVLVMQGGGSLGAFSCGVLKALVRENVKIDIVAGTSIEAINAAIIAGSKSDHPEIDLEDFWIELAESSYVATSSRLITLNQVYHTDA